MNIHMEKKMENKKESLKEKMNLLKEKVEAETHADFFKFEDFLKGQFSDCILMIKQWINDNNESNQLALKAVAQQLHSDKLNEIFSSLNVMEREKWKGLLDHFLSGSHLVSANKYLSEEVARAKISPSFIQDVELVDLLLSLSVDDACEFVKKHKDEAKTLLNLLSSSFTANILNKLDEDYSKSLVEESLLFEFDQVDDEFKSFKILLTEFKNEVRKNPFIYQVLKIVPGFNPLKETMLYKKLAENKLNDEMKKLAMDNFPSDLIYSLPKEFLKEVMQEYSMAKKVELLSSLEGDKKDQLMSSFAEEGSASREMLDLEFENIQNNQLALARIENQKDEIWKEFVYFIRQKVNENKVFTNEFEMLIAGWIDGLLDSDSNSRSNAA
jgi:hypothetical protein